MFRRVFSFILWVSGSVLLCVAYGFLVEPQRLVVNRLTIGEGDLQAKIVLVSDIHIGGMHVTARRVTKLAQVINRERADVVLMPGDFINGHTPRAELSDSQRAEIDAGLRNLSKIDGLLVGTIGNHDHWHDPVHVEKMLSKAGVRVVDNDGYRLNRLCFVGMADSTVARPNSDGFKVCQTDDVVIVLMHSPDAKHLLRRDVDLAVAGYTHGGQINLPILGRFVTATECGMPCAYGLIEKTPPVVVTAGVGTSILPARFRAPPEIVVITLLGPQ